MCAAAEGVRARYQDSRGGLPRCPKRAPYAGGEGERLSWILETGGRASARGRRSAASGKGGLSEEGRGR